MLRIHTANFILTQLILQDQVSKSSRTKTYNKARFTFTSYSNILLNLKLHTSRNNTKQSRLKKPKRNGKNTYTMSISYSHSIYYTNIVKYQELLLSFHILYHKVPINSQISKLRRTFHILYHKMPIKHSRGLPALFPPVSLSLSP
jgi:hypothetical protein